jgi:hypothetical protein
MDEEAYPDKQLKGLLGMLHAYSERQADDEDIVQVEDCFYPLRSQNSIWVNFRIRRELQTNKGHPISLIRQECLTMERDIQIKSARKPKIGGLNAH